MSSRIASFVSSGFGSGYAPKAPGTFGTVAAAVVWLGMSWAGVLSSLEAQSVCAVLTIFLGTLAIRLSLGSGVAKDPQWIVIDEWAGLYVALIGADFRVLWHVVLAFTLFRLFDISKVGPIRTAERLPGAVGIMSDDVVAGFFALLGMIAARYVV
jgi:phosphatidylglycerophosphatase A